MKRLNTPLKKFTLSNRAFRILTEAGVCSFGDLVKFTPNRLLRLRGFGATCLAEVEALLLHFKLELTSDPPDSEEPYCLPSPSDKTQKYIAALEKGWAAGQSSTEIARHLHIPAQNLKAAIRRYQLKAPEESKPDMPYSFARTQEYIAALKAGWAEGKTTAEVAEAAGVALEELRAVIRRYSLEPASAEEAVVSEGAGKRHGGQHGCAPITLEHLNALQAGLANGESVSAIARARGVTRTYLYMLKDKHKVEMPATPLLCVGCGKEFIPDRAGKKRCAPTCKTRVAASRPHKSAKDNPEWLAKMRAIHSDPEHRAKLSRSAKARWANPEYRQRALEAIRAANSTPEVRAKMSASQKARYAAGGFQKGMSETAREKRSQIARQLWADPEFRAKQMRARTEGLATEK